MAIEVYNRIATGELAGSATALQMPNIPCRMCCFKAVASNVGNVYLGVSTVTKVNGTTDTTSGFELGTGETSPWFPVSNLNLFYRICDNAGDDLTYIAIG